MNNKTDIENYLTNDVSDEVEKPSKIKSAATIIINLKMILSGYDIQFHAEKSRISESQYLYINFPKGQNYKFRISDHDYPIHLDEPPPDNKQNTENLAGFYDFRGDEYEKAKEVLMGLLASHKTPKHGAKPAWVDKVSGLIQDYFDGSERDINITHALQAIKKFNNVTIKNLYKYPTFTELLNNITGEGEEIPLFFKKLMEKHGIIDRILVERQTGRSHLVSGSHKETQSQAALIDPLELHRQRKFRW